MLKNKIYFSLICFFLLFFTCLKAQVIGTIEEIEGDIFYLNESDKILFEPYDDLMINQIINLPNNSKITLSLLDGTVFIFENESEFTFTEYNDLFSPAPSFVIKIKKGNFVVETGDIPKISRDKTKILINNGELILNGTAVSGDLSDSKADIFLMTDSFGSKGELKLQTASGESIDIAADSGLQIQGEAITPQQVDDQKLAQMQNLKTAIVNVAIVDEEKIEQILQKKIASGKIDTAELEQLKNKILGNKENKLNSIIQNTKENSSLLGAIVNNSKDDQAGKMLEKIMIEKPSITGAVVSEVVSANPEKLETVTKNNEALIDNIIKTVVAEAKDDDNNLANIVSKASPELTNKMMTEIVDSREDLAIQIVAKVSEANPTKVTQIFQSSQELAATITEAVATSVVNNLNGSDDFKKIFKSADPEVLAKVSASVDQKDSSLTQKAMTELLKEDPEEVKNVLKKSANSENSDLSEKIMKTAILNGEVSLVQESIVELAQEKANNPIQQDTEEDNLAKVNQNLENTLIQIQEEEKTETKVEILATLSDSLNNSLEQVMEEDETILLEIEEETIEILETDLASPS